MIIMQIILINCIYVMFGVDGFIKNSDAAFVAFISEVVCVDVPFILLICFKNEIIGRQK